MNIIILVVATIIVLFLLVDFFFVLLLERKNTNKKVEIDYIKEDNDKKIINSFSLNKDNYLVPNIDDILEDSNDDESFKKKLIDNMNSINKIFNNKKMKCECINYYENGIVTTYEIRVDEGQLIDEIVDLKESIINSIECEDIEYIIPFQNKSIGIVIQNEKVKNIKFKDSFKFLKSRNSKKELLIPIGKDLIGNYELLDLCECHNLVIGGDTGSGKSTFLQNIICSLLLKDTPLDVRFACIDTKGNELDLYNGLDMSLCDTVSDKDDAFKLMNEIIDEIYRRNDLLDNNMDRNITEYNKEVFDWNKDHVLNEEKKEKLNYILFIIDDFSDLMNYKKVEFEKNLLILGEMGPKVGVNIILSSRKPISFSNIVKGAFETKICFQVSSDKEYEAVLGLSDNIKLYGVGDMYLLKKDMINPKRIQAPNITINEVNSIINAIKGVK